MGHDDRRYLVGSSICVRGPLMPCQRQVELDDGAAAGAPRTSRLAPIAAARSRIDRRP